MQSTYTYDEQCVSDLHKDAFGFRPSMSWWGQWKTNTDAEKQAEWDTLICIMEQRELARVEFETKCAAKFEQLVADTIAMGARDVATAHRWIMEGSECDGDWQYLCYKHGLNYSYFPNTYYKKY
jgi:hypothetical protein